MKEMDKNSIHKNSESTPVLYILVHRLSLVRGNTAQQGNNAPPPPPPPPPALSRTVKEIEANLCFAIFGKNSKWPPFLGRGKFLENCKEYTP